MKHSVFLGLLLIGSAFAVPTEYLEDIKGGDAKISHGKDRTFVMFWASWCGTCKYKLQNTLPEMNKRNDVGVVTVNFGKNPKREKHYMKKNKIKDVQVFRVKKGTSDKDNLVKKLKVTNAPHWAVYKKDGAKWKLVEAQEGFKKEEIEKALKI